MATIGRIRLDDLLVGERFRRDLGDLDGLAQSLSDVGLLQPIVVDGEGRLIAGARRVAAATQLGWADIECRVLDLRESLEAQIDEDCQRKPLTLSEKVSISYALEDLARERARGRQAVRSANFSGVGVERGKALDLVAKRLGLSRPTLLRARYVCRCANEDPTRFDALRERMDRRGKVDGVYREALRSGLSCQEPSEPMIERRGVVVHPNWIGEAQFAGPSERAFGESEAFGEEVVWFWTEARHLPYAFGVVDALGLSVEATLVWIDRPVVRGPVVGDRTLHCLVAATEPLPALPIADNVLRGRPAEGRSLPETFYRLVDRVHGDDNRMELFEEPTGPVHHAVAHALVTDDAA